MQRVALVKYVRYSLLRRSSAKTPRDLWMLGRETAALDYGIIIPYHLVALVIVICYSVIAPIILLPAVAYFGLGVLVYKHQLLFVYVKQYEGFGKHWPAIFDHSIIGL
ncbi:hypothetical protein HDU93_006777, partial [Gonapodya sp. JEL0774]